MSLPAPLEALAHRFLPDPGRRAVAVKAVSFALIGVVNALVDLGVFWVFHSRVGLSIIAANLISWCVAVTGSYVMNSMTTFAAESGRKLRLKSYASFLLAQVAGFVANTATVIIAAAVIPILWRIFFGPDAPIEFFGHPVDPAVLGKVPAIGSSFLVNFSLSHFVVFRRRGPSMH